MLGRGTSPVRLILPDLTYQIGVEYDLPVIAQWGYNCHLISWFDTDPQNHFIFASGARGYGLGAHTSVLQEDMRKEPEPKDLGYLFPRQFPLWSTRIFSKEGELLRTSSMVFYGVGKRESDYYIDVGEYPQTIGVPVLVKSEHQVIAIADSLSGWPKLLPDGVEVEIIGCINTSAEIGAPVTVTLAKETRFVVKGPATVLPEEVGGEAIPFMAAFTLIPEFPDQQVEIIVINDTANYSITGEN